MSIGSTFTTRLHAFNTAGDALVRLVRRWWL